MEKTPTAAVRRFCNSLLTFIVSMSVVLIASSALMSDGPREITYVLGTEEVIVRVHDYGPGLTYVSLHNNETTAIAAAMSVIRERGGTLLELVHAGRRNITFNQGGVRFVFDPNRMFTEAGIVATLKLQGGTYSPDAHGIVQVFAEAVLDHISHVLDTKGLVVAAHNNSNRRLSIQSFLPGGKYASEARSVFVNPKMDEDDFFFVTTPGVYEALKAKNYNVVLQTTAMTDNGSLSVYCARRGVPYVNVEAQHGHLKTQMDMMRLLALEAATSG